VSDRVAFHIVSFAKVFQALSLGGRCE